MLPDPSSEFISVHIYPSTFEYESRILRVTKSLVKLGIFNKIFILALGAPHLPTTEKLSHNRYVYRLSTPFDGKRDTLFGKILALTMWHLKCVIKLRNQAIKCINCHSLTVLPVCVILKYLLRCNLVYEPHELETEKASIGGTLKPIAKAVEKKLIRCSDLVIVVGDEIAQWYKMNCDINNVSVIRNIPERNKFANGHQAHGLNHESRSENRPILFLYQGLLSEGRGIEKILNAFARINDSHKIIIFLGYGPLEDLVSKFSKSYNNIKFLGSVSPGELHQITRLADVGISLIENICLSYYYSQPNKMFEYLGSGLPIIVSDFPEMAKIIETYGCGWKISPDSEALYQLINTITWSDIARASIKSVDFSIENNWRIEEKKLVKSYQFKPSGNQLPHRD